MIKLEAIDVGRVGICVERAVLGFSFVRFSTLTEKVPYSTIKHEKETSFFTLYSKTAASILAKRCGRERCDITGNTGRFFDLSN